MAFVYIPVPEERVEEVYRLLAASDRKGHADEALLERIYRESDDAFRGLLQFLATQPGEAATTTEVASALELYRGTASLAGMLGAFGRRAKNRYDGYWPFSKGYNPVEESNELTMSADVAEVVRRLSEEQD